MSDEKKPLELYIHIPFCERKCAYCDFLSMPATLGVQRQYVEKLIDETPLISEVQRTFYKHIITERYHKILLESFEKLKLRG